MSELMERSARRDGSQPELELRIREWVVLGHFDRGDLEAARTEIAAFGQAAGHDTPMLHRREELWRAGLAMLALAAVEDQDDALGRHLATAVRIGGRCSYEAADGCAWRIVAAGPR